MPFLFSGQTNDTCDIYRPANAPPNPPDVAGVKVHVVPRFTNIKGDFLFTYSHIVCMPLSTDVRDGYTGNGVVGAGGDFLYFPAGAGSNWGLQLVVQFVARVRAGGGNDYKEVYCNFQAAQYPTQEG